MRYLMLACMLIFSTNSFSQNDGFVPLIPGAKALSDITMNYLKTCPPEGDETGAEWNNRCVPIEVQNARIYTRIIDGDTIEVAGEIIRIANIDAPETTNAKCEAERRLGEVAKSQLEYFVGEWSIKRIGVDKFGRTLAYLRFLDDQVDIGELMIEMKLAVPYDGGARQNWCE